MAMIGGITTEEADKKLELLIPGANTTFSPDQLEMLRFIIQGAFRYGFIDGVQKSAFELRASELHESADIITKLLSTGE